MTFKEKLAAWFNMKTTRAAILAAITAVIGYANGTVSFSGAVDQCVVVAMGVIGVYLASNIGE